MKQEAKSLVLQVNWLKTQIQTTNSFFPPGSCARCARCWWECWICWVFYISWCWHPWHWVHCMSTRRGHALQYSTQLYGLYSQLNSSCLTHTAWKPTRVATIVWDCELSIRRLDFCVGVRSTRSEKVTIRYCIKNAKRRITQITPNDSPGTLVFWRQRSWRNSNGVNPYGKFFLSPCAAYLQWHTILVTLTSRAN